MNVCLNCGKSVEDSVEICPQCNSNLKYQRIIDKRTSMWTPTQIAFYITLFLGFIMVVSYIIVLIKIGFYEGTFFDYIAIARELFLLYFIVPIGAIMSYSTMSQAKKERQAKRVTKKFLFWTRITFVLFLVLGVIPIIVLLNLN